MNEVKSDKVEMCHEGVSGSPESLHEGAVTVHAPANAGPPKIVMGEVLRAALNNAPIPAPVTEQLLWEANNGNLDAALVFAELKHYLDPSVETRVAITASLIPALMRDDPRAMFMMAVTGLSQSDDPKTRRRCLKQIRTCASAGVIEAAWWLAFNHDGTSWREINRRLEEAKDAGYVPALAATKFIKMAEEHAETHTANHLRSTCEESERRSREATARVDKLGQDHERQMLHLKGQIIALQGALDLERQRVDAGVAADERVQRQATELDAAKCELVRIRNLLSAQTGLAKKAQVALDEANKRSVDEAAALNRRIAHLEESLRRREARNRRDAHE